MLEFANYFGDILQQPAYVRKGETEKYLPPLVLTLANAAPEESSVNIRPNYQELLPHIDHYWLPVPSSGSFLYAVEVPENGPNTYWVNLAQAYEELDDATKQQIAGLQVRYFNFYGSREGIGMSMVTLNMQQVVLLKQAKELQFILWFVHIQIQAKRSSSSMLLAM